MSRLPARARVGQPSRVTRLLFVFGTRPEAIKLCPVIRHIRTSCPDLHATVCVTAQHRAMLDQVLTSFEVRPDHDLDLMTPDQTLSALTARVLVELDNVLVRDATHMVVVQGDTTTTMAATLAAFHRRIPVAHVEAGLRSGDMNHPFPEEMNRLVADRLAVLRFAPTDRARSNLLTEGIADDRILVTGNSGIDALLHVVEGLERGRLRPPVWPWLDPDRKLLLVTAHRRESFGGGIERICDAIAELAKRCDTQIVYPVHRNPNVVRPVTERLAGHPNVVLVEPLDYVPFIDLMRRAHIVITDSGGVQEEAPSLGKPVLVMRERTERTESLDAGTGILVGTDPTTIVHQAARLLEDDAEYARRSRVHNPYGDGHASGRIAAGIRAWASGRRGNGARTMRARRSCAG